MPITNADSSRWVYTYDNLGQVVSGKKYWSDGTPVAGQQFEYTFDDIGNRKMAAAGGDQYGANLRYANYTSDLLNRLTSRNVPGYVDIQGSATNTATVTVNNQPTYRHVDYFRAELSADNSASALWFGVTNVAVLNNGTNADIVASTTGNVFVAQSPETFAYDADGNVTNDGRWTFAWDAENRATSFTRISGTPAEARIKLDCQYDYGFRRIEKVVSGWNGSAYVAQSTNRFIYDGWNLVAVLNQTNGLLYSFAWGLDASRTMQGAGGVGGLISMTVHSGANTGTYFYAYDGNHNVAALVNAASGAFAAQYEYGPFGELVRATGPMASENPFLFSTKFYDWETGFCYYGYRYYDPSTGRWLGRDPLEELGGPNLYGFVFNGPTMYFDVNGDYTLGEWAQIYGAAWEGTFIGYRNLGNATWNLIKSPYTLTKSLSEAAGHLSTQYGRQRFGEQLYLASQLVDRFRRDECFRQRVTALLGDEAKIYFTDPYKLSELFAEIGVAAATAGAGAWAESANGAEKLAKLARLFEEFVPKGRAGLGRGLNAILDDYWKLSGGISKAEAKAIVEAEGFGFEIGRFSRFENGRGVIIGKNSLRDGAVNRIELAEEIQHGLDRVTRERSLFLGRMRNSGLPDDRLNEIFHAKHFQRILNSHQAGRFQFLSADDILALQRLVGKLK